jgi:hypothetical protein
MRYGPFPTKAEAKQNAANGQDSSSFDADNPRPLRTGFAL